MAYRLQTTEGVHLKLYAAKNIFGPAGP